MKLTGKYLFFILFTLCVPFVLSSIEKKLIGHQLMVSVSSETGRFVLYGRKDTEAKWVPLIFEESPSTPSSTFFRFFKDNRPVNFGTGGKESETSITFIEDSIVYTWKTKDVVITLQYTLVPSQIDLPLDTLFIDLTVENRTNKDYMMDFSFCIDTYLGEKSKNHFILPGNVLYNSESKIMGESMVSYVKSYSDRQDLGLYIYLDEKKQIHPDRVYFANWKRIQEASPSYKVVEGRNFDNKPYSINDSAVVLEYRNKNLLYDKKDSYRFILSMSNAFAYEEQVFEEAKTAEKDNVDSMEGSENKVEDSVAAPPDADELKDLSLTELMKLLDGINERIDSGDLTQEDLDYADIILEEIKSR